VPLCFRVIFINHIMKRFYVISIVLLFVVSNRCQAQIIDSVVDKLTIGVGAGYDFGGYGGNAIYYVERSIGLFAGVGYAIAGVGVNAGVKLRVLTSRSTTLITPFIIGMYGYYAQASPKDFAIYNKIFYGYTAGAGLDYRPRHSKFGYITATILVPFRTDDAQRYINDLATRRGLNYKNNLRSVTASIGYKFMLFR
jgi:hypothetical protein